MSCGRPYCKVGLLAGVARIFDFWGLLGQHEAEALERGRDAEAIRSDWRAVGADLWGAVLEYDRREVPREGLDGGRGLL